MIFLFSGGSREPDYIVMRGRRSVTLRDIYGNILKVEYPLRQTGQVAEFLAQIGQDYHRDNAAEGLLEKQEQLLG